MDYGRPDQHELAGGRSGVCGPAQAVVSVLLLESADVPWFRDDLTGNRAAHTVLARSRHPGSSPDLPNAIGTAKAGGTAVDLVRPRAMPLRIFRP
jgi:hypothetical protein